jgi:hypothetical protein
LALRRSSSSSIPPHPDDDRERQRRRQRRRGDFESQIVTGGPRGRGGEVRLLPVVVRARFGGGGGDDYDDDDDDYHYYDHDDGRSRCHDRDRCIRRILDYHDGRRGLHEGMGGISQG